MASVTRGRFIAFEGGEGMGKSTQARMLADALSARGIEVETTREPGGTAGAEAIRTLLLDPPSGNWSPQAEALLFAAARSDHVRRKILPSVELGRWVVCDRFVDSSRAYQGGAGGLGDDAIMALHRFGSDGLLPDLTLVFELGEDEARDRLDQRDQGVTDAIGGRDAEYHRSVRSAFLALAEADKARFAIIDGSGSPDDVHARVMAAIEPLLPSPC